MPAAWRHYRGARRDPIPFTTGQLWRTGATSGAIVRCRSNDRSIHGKGANASLTRTRGTDAPVVTVRKTAGEESSRRLGAALDRAGIASVPFAVNVRIEVLDDP